MVTKYIIKWYGQLQEIPSSLRRVTSGKRFINEIDGLRFLAIMPVLIQHLSERIIKYGSIDYTDPWSSTTTFFIFSRGTIGVFLFFTISGFILSLPFGKAYLSHQSPPTFKKYFTRRLTRLEPPFVLWMSLFAIVLALQSNIPFGAMAGHYLASIFYSHNFIYDSYSIINPVAWSLEVEFQFYVLAPVIAFGYFSIRNDATRRTMLIGIILLIPIIQSALGLHTMPWKASLAGQIQHFLLGFLMSDFYLNRKILFTKNQFHWDFIGVAALIMMGWSWSTVWYKQWIFSISTGLLFISAFNGKILNKYMINPWITAIGGMCYTIYLIHLPLLELFTQWSAPKVTSDLFLLVFGIQFLFWIPVILLFSGVCYLILEKPFMHPNWLSSLKTRINEYLTILKNLTSMMNKKSYVLLFILSFFLFNHLKSQDIPQEQTVGGLSIVEVDFENPELTQLMDIEKMVSLALEHSPLLKSQDIKISGFENELKLIRRKWMDYISLGGTYLYGTSILSDATESSLGLTDVRTLNRNNSIANVTLSARIPISEIFTKKIKSDKIIGQQRIEKYNKEAMVQSIRETIISHYNVLQTKIKATNIKAKELESLKLAAKFAEQFLREGDLDINEYTTAISSVSKAEYELLTYRSEANLAYQLLQEIIGAPITKQQNQE